MGLGALIDILIGAADATDVVAGATGVGERRHLGRTLVMVWLLVLVTGVALWRWFWPMIERMGSGFALLAVLWGAGTLYALIATIAWGVRAWDRRGGASSRPAS